MSNPFLTVCKASAGSGKTFKLTLEYLFHLLSEQDVINAHKTILAITFTNKATEEMKNRILSALDDLRNNRQTDFKTKLQARLKFDNDTLQQKSELALQGIIHDYSNFHVKTIDSFLQGIINDLGHLLNLPANSKVSLNDEEIIDIAIQRLLESIEKDKQKQKWFSNYIQARIEEQENWVIENEIKDFAKNNVLTDTYQLIIDDKLKSEYTNETKINKYKQTLKDFLQREEEILLQKKRNVIKELTPIKDSISYVSYIDKYLDNATIKGDEPNNTIKSYISKDSTTQKDCIKKSAKIKVDPTNFLDALREFVENHKNYWCIKYSIEHSIQNLYPLQLLNEIDKLIQDVNKEQNHTLLSQTKQIFSKNIKGEDSPFIFENAGIRYKHIMIDEFQDTARTQWNNLQKLLINGLAQGNDGLLVGDIKQSIYRWNGGDWKILQDIKEEIAPQEVKIESLKDNYRSRKEIVEFNNNFFLTATQLLDKDISENQKETNTFQTIYADVEQTPIKGTGGYVCGIIQKAPDKKQSDNSEQIDYSPLIDYYSIDNEEIENPYSLYQQIKKLHQKGHIAYNDIAILVRYKKETQKILQYFSKYHTDIPIVSQEAFMYSSSPYIILLIEITKWIHNEENKLSLAISARIYQEFILQTKYNKEDLIKKPLSFLPLRLQDKKEKENLHQLSLYNFYLELIQLFELNTPTTNTKLKGQQAFILSFLDEVLTFIENKKNSIKDFLEYWNNQLQTKTIPSAETNGVQIITIHKSKGLAFHSVLIPFCDWELQKSKRNTKNFFWWSTEQNIENEYFNNLLTSYSILPILPNPTKIKNSIYRKQYEEEQLYCAIDNLNTLYVAFTRPKQNIIFWSNSNKDLNKENWTIGDLNYYTLKSLYPSSFSTQASQENESWSIIEIGELKQTDNIHHAPENPLPFKVEVSPSKDLELNYFPSRQVFRQSTLSQEYWQTDEKSNALSPIEKGNLYHKILSLIKYIEDIDIVVNQLYHQGLLPFDVICSSISEYLHQKIKAVNIKDWFTPKWKIYNEISILSHSPEGLKERRPDRVMIGTNKTIVVDFKFGSHHTKYEKQIKSYMRLLQQLGYKNVEGKLWYVEDEKIIEII